MKISEEQIKLIVAEKRVLRIKIFDLLDAFHEKTGVRVAGLDFDFCEIREMGEAGLKNVMNKADIILESF